MFIEDTFTKARQSHQIQRIAQPSTKDFERGFFPGSRTDRFEWQNKFRAHEEMYKIIPSKRQDPRQVSTEGRWDKLIQKTSDDITKKRSISSSKDQNTSSIQLSSARVIQPELRKPLEEGKTQGLKVFSTLIHETWQNRRIENHEKSIESRRLQNCKRYVDIDGIIPNTTGRERPQFSRLGKCDISFDIEGRTAINSSHLSLSSLTPTEQRSTSSSRISREQMLYNQGGLSVSNLLDYSKQNLQEVNQKPKQRKFVYQQQKDKVMNENSELWEKQKSQQAWKEVIKSRETSKYGRDCDRSYILANNVMFINGNSNDTPVESYQRSIRSTSNKELQILNSQQLSDTQSYTDLIGERNIKADLLGINKRSIISQQSINRATSRADSTISPIRSSNSGWSKSRNINIDDSPIQAKREGLCRENSSCVSRNIGDKILAERNTNLEQNFSDGLSFFSCSISKVNSESKKGGDNSYLNRSIKFNKGIIAEQRLNDNTNSTSSIRIQNKPPTRNNNKENSSTIFNSVASRETSKRSTSSSRAMTDILKHF